ncbi:Uncharacterized protein TCM_004240 [Theobroma cacao]|uniref:Uncharacterized protein n=1 Tax=Theobroma cacao TaxID=3641 RepID=A0A061DQD1_THECC|nr:Uncharacterized protein TCM_004240 [Theobroma cacao]
MLRPPMATCQASPAGGYSFLFGLGRVRDFTLFFYLTSGNFCFAVKGRGFSDFSIYVRSLIKVAILHFIVSVLTNKTASSLSDIHFPTITI